MPTCFIDAFFNLFHLAPCVRMRYMDITEFPISPNPGQQNMDKVGANINDMVKDAMGVLPDTGPEGRRFLKGGKVVGGYDGVVVSGGKIVTLVNLKGDEDVPAVRIGTELTIEGDSHGYVPSGHKPGDKVKVVGFIEPFFHAKEPSIQSSDRIIQVEGLGIVGWIKPSNFDTQLLKKQGNEEVQKLFSKPKV